MLRAVQLGISIADLELLTVGLVIDMCTEAMNDRAYDDEDEEQGEVEREATQTDFNNF